MTTVNDTLEKFWARFSERRESAILINSSDKIHILLTRIISLHAYVPCYWHSYLNGSIIIIQMGSFMQMRDIIFK